MKKTYELVGRKTVQPDGSESWVTGIKCYVCYLVSWKPDDVRNKICTKCGFFHAEDWSTDLLITMKRRNDPVFATKFLRALLLYRLHWHLVHRFLAAARTLRKWLGKSPKEGALPPEKEVFESKK